LQKATIRLTSVTYAIRAQKLLEMRGIRSIVRKGARSMHVTGCSYGIEISSVYLDNAIDILDQNGISILDIVY
jgi:hypothetical protein